MAISDTITSMYDNTSNAYTMLSYGTDLTGINKNLENLSSTIFEAFLEALRNPDTLFTNLPKTSGSGSQIILNGTANAPMRINPNPTAISQDGTPTPDSPQDIHTISGNNSIIVKGKNMLSLNNITFTRIYEASIEEIQAGTYTLSGYCTSTDTDSNVCAIIMRNGNTNVGTKTFSRGQINTTITLSDTANAISIYASDTWVHGEGDTATFTNLMISTNGGDYEPYVSQTNPINLGEYELGTIGNYSNEFVRSNGENLFDNSTITSGKFVNDYGNYGTDATAFVSDYIEITPNTDYYISGRTTWKSIGLYDSSKTFLERISPTNATGVLNITNNNCKYIRINASSSDINTLMLNKGTTALPYVPYEKGWYYKQGIGKATNNTISNGSSYSNIVYFSFPKPVDSLNYIWASRNTQVIYSNAQHSTSGNWNSADNIGKIVGGASEHTFWVGFPVGTTLAQAQEQLANDILYYIKATPTYTKITGELANQLEQVYKGMLSYDGTTNISQVNNDLSFSLSASAIEELS